MGSFVDVVYFFTLIVPAAREPTSRVSAARVVPGTLQDVTAVRDKPYILTRASIGPQM